jgi:hypothetical protein
MLDIDVTGEDIEGMMACFKTLSAVGWRKTT